MVGRTKRSAKAAKKTAPEIGRRGAGKTSSTTKRPAARKRGSVRRSAARKKKSSVRGADPVLLSGGNPQIAKGDGDAPVQAYITAMPGWKRDVGRRLDAIITRTLPDVKKAVKWNSPFYGVEGEGWFLGIHCFTKYVKLAFFRGALLSPKPPGPSKTKDTRYLDIRERDTIDEKQLASWVRQAASMPGWKP